MKLPGMTLIPCRNQMQPSRTRTAPTMLTQTRMVPLSGWQKYPRSRRDFAPCLESQTLAHARLKASATKSGPLQERPELADILYGFEIQQFVDQGVAFCCSEDRGNEIARFGDNLFAAHRVFRSAADGLDALGQFGSVVEGDLDNGHALGDQFFQLFFADRLHLGAHAEDFRVLHARLIVGRFEGCS